MAKLVKNFCDYFPHDRDMRNHRKIKAIRTKFGISGYAIWVMTLEYLTGSDSNVFEYSDVEFELMGGDYGVSATEIRELVDYCLVLEILFLKDGFVSSESLDERLAPVYEKRGKSKERSAKQARSHGKFSSTTTDTVGESATASPQKKVKESKVKESKVKSDGDSVADLENKKIELLKNVKDPFEGKLEKWNDWKVYKKKEKNFTFKTAESETQGLKNLFDLSGGDFLKAEKIINQSIGNGWSGLFQLKNYENGKQQNSTTIKSVGRTIEFDKP